MRAAMTTVIVIKEAASELSLHTEDAGAAVHPTRMMHDQQLDRVVHTILSLFFFSGSDVEKKRLRVWCGRQAEHRHPDRNTEPSSSVVLLDEALPSQTRAPSSECHKIGLRRSPSEKTAPSSEVTP